MKSWYKILVFVVLGAFAFPNAAKVLHNCEATHQHCDHNHSDEKHDNGLFSSVPEVSNHDCYICNFHFAGFEVESQLILNFHVNTYKTENAFGLLSGCSSIIFPSNPHRGPPINLI